MDLEPEQEKQSGQIEDRVRIEQISDDPYSVEHIRFTAFRLLGYPLKFRPNNIEPPNKEGHRYLDVYIDPAKREVIKELKYQVFLDGIQQILNDIDEGRPHRLAKLLKGEEEDYYSFSPQSPKGSNPESKYHCDQETLKQCYMRAYERYYEKVKAGTMYFDKKEDAPYGPFTATPDSNDIRLYEEYQQENLTPISSDNLVQMTKQVAEKILNQQTMGRKP